ncbi:MAG: aminopeptidase N [Alphaproteobacteria bacterium]
MRTETPVEIRREDYTPPSYGISSVNLEFDLTPTGTEVIAKLRFQPWKNESVGQQLRLVGEDLNLLEIAVDDDQLPESDYVIDSEGLTLLSPPIHDFTLSTRVAISPQENTRLEGLYLSNGIYCTQCEAEGFRRITYFLDRPDVMASYEVEIRAPKAEAPVLLSNGDLIASGDLSDGRHFARWRDPHKKPSYLFALVAGDLGKTSDTFTTKSGKPVDLAIWTEHDQIDKTDYAMDALKRSMAWEEEIYGLEYDLNQFNIVAISDFNMGAMENKSLNIFNAKYILANPLTATDNDYSFIESVVAHEYFHNWTGNRVTCRDWFQLSLKEGLTVFRDQQFSADMRSEPVQRIQDVRQLRARQFPEDAGPLAHPIRPDSYIEINNFYTATVYEKGAEVIRMLSRLIGWEDFRKGIDLYFERHDGTAATCDDFIDAMADASGKNLSLFRRWYSQSGTPTLHVTKNFQDGIFELTIHQKIPPTPGQSKKEPMEMPIEVGLIGPDGKDIVSKVLILSQEKQSWTFEGLKTTPVISINRSFTSPVKIDDRETDSDRSFRMAHDQDAFNRWEAGQAFAQDILIKMVEELEANRAPQIPSDFLAAWEQILKDPNIDPAFRSLLMTLPSVENVAEAMTIANFDAIFSARQTLRNTLALANSKRLEVIWNDMQDSGDFNPSAIAAGKRALSGTVLAYLSRLPNGDSRALEAASNATNMTDKIAALSALNDMPGRARDIALQNFREDYDGQTHVLDKWFSLVATAPIPSALSDIRQAMRDPTFTLSNPNKARALIGGFVAANPTEFHREDGSGYAFHAEMTVTLDQINPQTAARMLAPLGRWRRMDEGRQSKMRNALEEIASTQGVSRDVFEIATKALKT